MISLDDMKYYIDPIATPYEDARRIYVQQVRYERVHAMVGQIINVKPGGDIDGHRMWHATENGYYVYGQPVGSASVSRYSPVVAKIGDIFAFGEQTTASKRHPGKRNLVNVRLSNGKRMPGSAYLPVTDWIPAAEWAWECMPADGDSEEVVEAKLTLAKQKWDTRYAKLEVMRQGLSRGWTKDLRKLQEEGVLFKGVYGARITGTALMSVLPDHVTLDEGHKALLAKMQESPIAVNKSNQSAYVGIPVKFFASLEANSYEEAASPSGDLMNTYLRSKTGFSHSVMGSVTAQPVLTGTK